MYILITVTTVDLKPHMIMHMIIDNKYYYRLWYITTVDEDNRFKRQIRKSIAPWVDRLLHLSVRRFQPINIKVRWIHSAEIHYMYSDKQHWAWLVFRIGDMTVNTDLQYEPIWSTCVTSEAHLI